MQSTIGWSRIQSSLIHTCTHDVVSEEWGPEPKGQHEQVAGEARKQPPEACGISAEVGEGTCNQYAVRMEAHDVVVSGVQVSGLHQLQGLKNRTDQLAPLETAGSDVLRWPTLLQLKHVPPIYSFNTIFDPLNPLSAPPHCGLCNCPKTYGASQ